MCQSPHPKPEPARISVTNDLAWVDHIHGKAHNKQLGFSMRVKPDTEDEVCARGRVGAVSRCGVLLCASARVSGFLHVLGDMTFSKTHLTASHPPPPASPCLRRFWMNSSGSSQGSASCDGGESGCGGREESSIARVIPMSGDSPRTTRMTPISSRTFGTGTCSKTYSNS
jgi:hypothetical protein